ncbi:MAG TPA: hypothetical protein VH206_23630 [Xanthobacteraceae bacterium]|jgi:hypothetical protein|nr:hypothetical protein [Xanthobacteraceae bacterium]
MTIKTPKYLVDMWHVATRPAGMLALLYALAAFVAGFGADLWKESKHSRFDRIAELAQSFNETTAEFDALVAAMANGIMDSGKSDADDRAKLIKNLNQQYSEVDELAPVVKSNATVDTYKKSLSALNAVLPAVNDPQSMKSYWGRVSDVLVARRTLRTELNKKADLGVD